jgi:ribosomal protein RSM22 (predicted rRNA methylase)
LPEPPRTSVSPELPPRLRAEIEALVEPHARARLESAARRLSETYRAGGAAASRVARTREEVAAYAAYRAPATYAAAVAVLAEVSARLPGWRPSSVLDIGAGPGVASWAAAAVWPDIARFTLVEAEPEMIAAGRRLTSAAQSTALAEARWIHGDVSVEVDNAELILASYVLGELDEGSVASAATRLWSQTDGTLVLIEPGTPAGYRRVIAARSVLVAEGGRTAAPCPHDDACPLVSDDWCHFATRLPRGEAHRAVKGVSRGFEDEKLSYVVISRVDAVLPAGRVIRPPLLRSGHVHIDICGPEGIARRIVSRRDKELYRTARDLRWGDAIPPDMPTKRDTEQS